MNTEIVSLPAGHDDDKLILSVSGGKDSTALILAMREREIECEYVFADTQWEAPETYAYLGTLEDKLNIRIHRVTGAGNGMANSILDGARFASRLQRWCTDELKVAPVLAFHEVYRARWDVDTISVVGIRRDESRARNDAAGFEYDRKTDWYTWRPLIHWSVQDVFAIHHKHNIPINPLYRMGFGRVGCMPCIMSTKADIRLMAKHYPERVELINQLEQHVTAERTRRNEVEPGRYKHVQGTFFLAAKRRTGEVTPIDKVVAWSRTKHGGKVPLIDETPDSGCFRWGFCDAPVAEPEQLIPAGNLTKRVPKYAAGEPAIGVQPWEPPILGR